MKVIILPQVLDYLENLVEILYQKEYFGFRESSREYVVELIERIEGDLPLTLHKPAPAYFDPHKEDMHYVWFRVNRQTTWYAFFTKYVENNTTIYLVQHIENNHTIAQYL